MFPVYYDVKSTESIDQYWEEYNFNRFEPIDLPHFEVLILVFPILTVVAADEDIDSFEKSYYLCHMKRKYRNN